MSKEQLFQLLPMPDDGLQQVLEYAASLSKQEAAEHFSNMLGDSPQVIEFISTFNARRSDPKTPPASRAAPAPTSSSTSTAQNSAPNSEVDGVPKPRRGPKKKKTSIHTPAPRQVASFALGPGTVYSKKDLQDEYISARSGASTPSNAASGPSKPPPTKTGTPPPTQVSKPPPSALGSLVSDLGQPKSKNKSNPTSQTSTPGPSSSRNNNGNTAKISITGGVAMHGSSTVLSDLDQAIRSLEITTNPSHSTNSAEGVAARRCNCVGTRHPPLAAAPNCLNCGKVICIKEGPGPCTFCGQPLLSSAEIQSMIKELRADRGREKMAADREAHKKADVAGTPRPFTRARDPTIAEAHALAHRDKLLAFQAQNAQRTTVRDEAADFDATVGGSMWATPEERALALKKQQKLLREMEWNAKPEYEKRQQVVSIDLSGRKVFKKMAKIERPPTPVDVNDVEDEYGYGGYVVDETHDSKGKGQGGAFSKNPLLSGVIRPVYDLKGKGEELEGRKDRATKWRRVQDDLENNEQVILDGGIYGGSSGLRVGTVGDEPECG
ncbi:hypothetical protein QBC36DRAFT_331848 [Triangularia setosa]|uniref:TRIP4/RQT4 C2HC5-type zinc finger domain-containing protein n=1 Tax=Triangularia setosa TaxID=2587417 RepID=A0AAN6W4V5_9PEZI|nr:hypothetical protein QBC36DRAFT_331848 [Podospora setosa]